EFLLKQKKPPFRILDSAINNSFHAPNSVEQQFPILTEELSCSRLSSSRATASNSSQKSFYPSDSVPKSSNALESVPFEQQPPKQQKGFPRFRFGYIKAISSSSLYESIYTPNYASVEQQPPIPSTTASMLRIQLNNSVQFATESPPFTPVKQQPLILTEEFPCFRPSCSIGTSSSFIQKSLHSPDSASSPVHSRKVSMLLILIQYNNSLQFLSEDRTTAPNSFYNSLQFAPKESLPVSFNLSPLQKSSYASDSAPVDRQLPTLTKEHPCFRLNCSIATSLSSLQRSFNASDSVPKSPNASDSVPIEQQPPKQQQ
uniref:Uncharacterized protein n=1 Tax=Strongyloides stercoralis TaxID=6248 RepID=A0AAF5D075_STRER